MSTDDKLLGRDFNRADLSRSRFNEILLADSQFSNVDFQGSVFHGVSFRDVKMSNLDVQGMCIEGILVSELLRVYRAQVK